MLIVAGRLPSSASEVALAQAARVTGLAAADVRARLAGSLPRVLHVEADPERAAEISRELEDLGFGIINCDPRAAPGDEDRLQARGLRFTAGNRGLVVTGADGSEQELPWTSLALVQRAVRATTVTEVTKKSERRLDLTRAILSGGLMLTRRVETSSTRTTSSRDGLLLLHRADGERDVVIYERRIDYRFLGEALQPSSAGNFERLIARLRAAIPRVPYDDRALRPGFLSGLPVSSNAAVDVALWLVHLLHLRGL